MKERSRRGRSWTVHLTGRLLICCRIRRDPHQVVEEIITALLPAGARSHFAARVSGLEACRIHHLGIAVESLAAAVPVFQKLVGKAPDAEETVADQKVRVVSFHLGERRSGTSGGHSG